MTRPIWKDYAIRVGGSPNFAYADFSITYDGNIVYSGRAYPLPGNEYADIVVNDICANYLRNEFPIDFPDAFAEIPLLSTTMEMLVTVVYRNGTTSQESHELAFTYDYSYDRSAYYIHDPDDQEPEVLLAPILRKIPGDAPFVITVKHPAEIIVRDTQWRTILRRQLEPGTNTVINLEETYDSEFKYLDIEGLADFGAGFHYELVENCGIRYMLYYLNALGGWDFLAVEGKDIQTDNYTRHTIGQSYDNVDPLQRGTRNYANDVTRKWQLNTLWIDDEGAKNMHHLLGSVDVYLYDLDTATIYPVTINNSSCEYKTYSNQGNQLVRYEIEATLATNITRR